MNSPTLHLPSDPSLEEYRALRAEPARWLPAAAAIAAAHAVTRSSIRPVEEGSNLIAFVGDDLVIKLFPPFMRNQFASEHLALEQLRGRLETPIPEITAHGESGGWPYILMTRVGGVPLSAIWGDRSLAERSELLHAIGRLIAEVQAVAPGPLTALEPEWSAFLAAQAAGCRARQERLGLPRRLLDGIDTYLERTRGVLPENPPPAILTGEYTPGNILAQEVGGRWRLAGMIDFGDVMVGFREYDLLGPCTFLASGDPGCTDAFLKGYGYTGPEVTCGLSARLMRMLLLHRYCNLAIQVRLEGWPDSVRSLDDLERRLWPGLER